MYLLVKNGTVEKYPYSLTDLVRDNRHISWPAVVSNELAETYGCCEVVEVEPPIYDLATQTLVETDPININGQWNRQWTIIDKTAEEIEAGQLEYAQRTAAEVTQAIDALHIATCKKYEYDNMNNATGWAPFYPKAMALALWGKACWDKSTEIRAEVLAGSRPLPTVEEVMAEMPEFAP